MLAAPVLCGNLLAPDLYTSLAFLLVGFALSEMWRAPAAVMVRDVSPPSLGATGSAVHLCVRNLIGGLGPLGESPALSVLLCARCRADAIHSSAGYLLQHGYGHRCPSLCAASNIASGTIRPSDCSRAQASWVDGPQASEHGLAVKLFRMQPAVCQSPWQSMQS